MDEMQTVFTSQMGSTVVNDRVEKAATRLSSRLMAKVLLGKVPGVTATPVRGADERITGWRVEPAGF